MTTSQTQPPAAQLQEFAHAKFGTIRSACIDGTEYFVGRDVSIALGYKNVSRAVRLHVSEGNKLSDHFGTLTYTRYVHLNAKFNF